jgi:hypothetical protein
MPGVAHFGARKTTKVMSKGHSNQSQRTPNHQSGFTKKYKALQWIKLNIMKTNTTQKGFIGHFWRLLEN